MRVQQELARCPAKVKYVAAENIHLTLKFLGEIDEETAAGVRGAMCEVGRAAAWGGGLRLGVGGLGYFPPRGAPRVIWAGVTDGADAVCRLQARLERELAGLGFEPERRFVPHLTLGRVKSSRGGGELVSAIESRADAEFGSCTACEMVLFESRLTPRGAVYRAVVRQAL